MKQNQGIKNRHLTQEERIEIQECLSHGMTFKAIAIRVGRVKTACSFDKHVYRAKAAHDGYRQTLHESREGIPLTKQEFWQIDEVITKGIRDGQHLYHILQTNNLAISIPTAYRHFHKDYFSVSLVDLPRQVKFKPRAKKEEQYVPKGVKIGRSYHDFLQHKAELELTTWWEMDTVIGKAGGKCVLTFNFVPCNFMFGLLLNNKSAQEVTDKIKALKAKLLSDGLRFGDIFPEILTDNGSEFANVHAIENSLQGLKETHLFFADPYCSHQKPHVEKTHTCLRNIVPQGTSFDNFTQETLDTIFSHMNSTKRRSLCGKTALEAFSFWHNSCIVEYFGVIAIDPNAVIQNKKLLQQLSPTAETETEE